MQIKTGAAAPVSVGVSETASGGFLPLAKRGEAVFLCAQRDDLLCFGKVGLHVLGPELQRGRLHRAAVRERQRPWVRADLVHGIEVRSGLLVALTAGKEHDSRQ